MDKDSIVVSPCLSLRLDLAAVARERNDAPVLVHARGQELCSIRKIYLSTLVDLNRSESCNSHIYRERPPQSIRSCCVTLAGHWRTRETFRVRYSLRWTARSANVRD